MKHAFDAYRKHQGHQSASSGNNVDMVVTTSNRIVTTMSYRFEKSLGDVAGVRYPSSKSNYALYLERSV